MGKPAPKKFDGRSRDAKRLKALVAGIEDPDVQAAQLRRRAAGLALRAEHIEAKIARGEDIDDDLYTRLCGAHARCLDKINELTPKPSKYWTSSQEEAARQERLAYLDTLTEEELRELKKQVQAESPSRSALTT